MDLAFPIEVMWNIRKFEIVLDNPHAIFYPGQCVKGQVIIEVAEDMKMKGTLFLT